MKKYKGSNRCVLEWLDSPGFLSELNELLQSTSIVITPNDYWKPIGTSNDKESELKDFLKEYFNSDLGNSIRKWWLAITERNSRTPNWDLLSTCNIKGKKGLLLIEAKAHASELDKESKGKYLRKKASINSLANHKQIGEAIEQANNTINIQVPGISISRDKCYQLSNRIAHAWWLANQGIPVVLLYLGFLNVEDMKKDNYKIFKSPEEWDKCFRNHAQKVGVDRILNSWINCGQSEFITVCKST